MPVDLPFDINGRHNSEVMFDSSDKQPDQVM